MGKSVLLGRSGVQQLHGGRSWGCWGSPRHSPRQGWVQGGLSPSTGHLSGAMPGCGAAHGHSSGPMARQNSTIELETGPAVASLWQGLMSDGWADTGPWAVGRDSRACWCPQGRQTQ